MSDKNLVLYHYPCQDGFTAAWAVWRSSPDWEFYPAKHGDPPPRRNGTRCIFRGLLLQAACDSGNGRES